MGWRKTPRFHSPEPIRVLTCDACECDIGHEDGRRPREHFVVARHANGSMIAHPTETFVVCSCECLRSWAATATGPDRTPPPFIEGSKS
jgi:hypothetical protein